MNTPQSKINKELLQLEKLRKEIELDVQNIETELARRHNWAQQEKHWRYIAWTTGFGFSLSLLTLAFGVVKWLTQ